jgi:tetratricopeptide (TPR) repeat protein
MKQFFLILSATLSFSLYANSELNERQELYDKALGVYQSGDYRKTLEVLRSVDQQSADMLYLMGDAANKLQHYGYALAYWRTAQRVWPMRGRVHLARLINQVKTKIGVEAELSTTTRSAIFVSDVLRALPLVLIQVIFLALWTFLFLYLRYLYQKKHKKLVVTFFILLFTAGVFLVSKISIDRKLHAVVVVPTTTILSGPGKTFHSLGSFKEGAELKVITTADGFYKVRLGKLVGWVMKDHVVMTVISR